MSDQPKTVLVCGSRIWSDPRPIKRALTEASSEGFTCLVHGDCRGADRLAGALATRMGFHVCKEPANWGKYGKAAGPIRNQLMLDEYKPERVYAFPLEHSRGTLNMIDKSHKAGVKEIFAWFSEENDFGRLKYRTPK